MPCKNWPSSSSGVHSVGTLLFAKPVISGCSRSIRKSRVVPLRCSPHRNTKWCDCAISRAWPKLSELAGSVVAVKIVSGDSCCIHPNYHKAFRGDVPENGAGAGRMGMRSERIARGGSCQGSQNGGRDVMAEVPRPPRGNSFWLCWLTCESRVFGSWSREKWALRKACRAVAGGCRVEAAGYVRKLSTLD